MGGFKSGSTGSSQAFLFSDSTIKTVLINLIYFEFILYTDVCKEHRGGEAGAVSVARRGGDKAMVGRSPTLEQSAAACSSNFS